MKGWSEGGSPNVAWQETEMLFESVRQFSDLSFASCVLQSVP
jgi:hypothetical protein